MWVQLLLLVPLGSNRYFPYPRGPVCHSDNHAVHSEPVTPARLARTSASVLPQQLLHGLASQPGKVCRERVQGSDADARHRCFVLLARDVVAAAAKGIPQLAVPAHTDRYAHRHADRPKRCRVLG